MAVASTRYPNLAAEMARNGIDYGSLYDGVSGQIGKSRDTVANWVTGRAGELPTKVAFIIRDEYFPNLTVDYLFSNEPKTY